MSADNVLVYAKGSNGSVIVYEVSMSDITDQPFYSTDGEEHKLSEYLARNYAKSILGVFPDQAAADKAADLFCRDNYVEYGVSYYPYIKRNNDNGLDQEM